MSRGWIQGEQSRGQKGWVRARGAEDGSVTEMGQGLDPGAIEYCEEDYY